jgi:hypothetical protein
VAVLNSGNVIPVVVLGNADLVGLYSLRNVTNGDTIDMATLDPPRFQVVKRAVVIGVSDFVEIAANFAGTVVTMPPGLNASSGYLLLWGC